MKLISLFIPTNQKSILFSSFGGRKFDDSPKALYDTICSMDEFRDWKLIWAFVDPEMYDVPRGEKVKIDTWSFFKSLLSSRVWVSNSEMDRGIRLQMKRNLRVETWHGTPLKKICGEENETAVEKVRFSGLPDNDTIRCAQSKFDQEIFSRVFHATKESILICDLPRNDELIRYEQEDIVNIKNTLNIPLSKKVILYVPTYREFLSGRDVVPPITLEKWRKELYDDYVLLVRAHYAVTESLGIVDDDFVKDVSDYHHLNDLYAIADIMVSDYSSTFFDYAILDRPMFCLAYDREEYETKRGLYLNMEKELPCPVDKDEDSLLRHIVEIDSVEASAKTRAFHMKYAPNAGHACDTIIEKMLERLEN